MCHQMIILMIYAWEVRRAVEGSSCDLGQDTRFEKGTTSM